MINGREIALLTERMRRVHEAGGTPALVTLLHVKGSAYRRPGSKMLVTPDGATTCMISGGCLEQELAELAEGVIESGRARQVHYDLNEDEVWGLGLGCGGEIDLVIEAAPAGSPVSEWVQMQARGIRAVSALRLSDDGLSRSVVRAGTEPDDNGDPGGVSAGAVGSGRVEGDPVAAGAPGYGPDIGDPVTRRALQILRGGEARSRLERVGESGERVFFDISLPPINLVLFGGGPDAVPLARYAADIGWAVTVVDPRAEIATREAFPRATIVQAHPPEFSDNVAIGENSVVVIMNHHLERDRESLRFALAHSPAYIGLLGPYSRFETLVAALEREGDAPSEEALSRVHTPVGLDIGAEGPEEIAVSVLSEVLMLSRGHRGGQLSHKRGAIHERDTGNQEQGVSENGNQ